MDASPFAASYVECRRKFLDSCSAAGAATWAFEHPLAGPQGEGLFTDVARLGPADAKRVLVVESGLHGAEGFAGSAVQNGVLRAPAFRALPPDLAVILVHAINPWGFAWNRRFNEDNIDLNRHFVDWDNPGDLSNPGYDDISGFVIPSDLSEQGIADSNARLEAYRAAKGEAAFSAAVKLGQYRHPKGLYFGGTGPSWSSRMVQTIADRFLASATAAGLIDIHTGLGPFGFGECLSGEAPDSDEGRRATAWYGHVAHTKSASTAYAGSKASILDGYRRAAPHPVWTPVGLEFGTRAQPVVRDAVRYDGWLYLNGFQDNPEWPRVKAAMSHAYNPGEAEWQAAVVARGVEVVAQGVAGLSGTPFGAAP